MTYEEKIKQEERPPNLIKRRFVDYFDGAEMYSPPEGRPTTLGMGVCLLEYDIKEDTLHVYLRRPGLLIGKSGETIDGVQDYLGCTISIHEVIIDR